MEAEGIGRTSANYRHITVKKALPEPDKLHSKIVSLFASLQNGPLSSAENVARVLAAGQKPWRFSPFARYLPDPLLVSALVERSFDIEGLLQFVGTTRLVTVKAR